MINPFSNPSYLLPPIFVLIACLILAVFTLYRTPRDYARWLFFCLLLSMALWSLLTFGMRSSADVRQALLWEKVLILAAVMVFVIYYHFTLILVHTRAKSGVLIILYCFLALFAFLASTDLIAKEMTLQYYGYSPMLGPLGYALFAAGPVLILAGDYNLFRAYKASRSYEERNRLIYLIIGEYSPFWEVDWMLFQPYLRWLSGETYYSVF